MILRSREKLSSDPANLSVMGKPMSLNNSLVNNLKDVSTRKLRSYGITYLPSAFRQSRNSPKVLRNPSDWPFHVHRWARDLEARSGIRIFPVHLRANFSNDTLLTVTRHSHPLDGPSGNDTLNFIPFWITISSPGRTIILSRIFRPRRTSTLVDEITYRPNSVCTSNLPCCGTTNMSPSLLQNALFFISAFAT